MNNYKEETSDSYCYFHPKEPVIGVCPLCLHERLLILLAATNKQRRRQYLSSSSSSNSSSAAAATCSSSSPRRHKKKPSILFSLGSLLINRLEFRNHHPKSYDDDDDHDDDKINPDCGFDYGDNYDDASTSLEDSFISIQFQDNGKVSWEKGIGLVDSDNKSIKKKIDQNKKKLNSNIHCYKDERSVVGHSKPRGGGSLRWRKRIGHMFHLVRWKRSSKANTCHVGSKVEGLIKVRSNKGWNLRTLSKRRSTRE